MLSDLFHKNNKPQSEIDDLAVSIGSSDFQKRTVKGLFAFTCCSCGAFSESLRENQNFSVFLGKSLTVHIKHKAVLGRYGN